jgi:hypothetical protein
MAHSKEYERLDAKHPAARAVRVWKRDGTRNVMPLASAAFHLSLRATTKLGPCKLSPDEAAELLMAGERIETKRAWFRMFYGRGAAR